MICFACAVLETKRAKNDLQSLAGYFLQSLADCYNIGLARFASLFDILRTETKFLELSR